MSTRLVIVCALALVGLSTLMVPAEPGTAAEPPSCYDYITEQLLVATKWLNTPGTLSGTTGRDVLVGTTGSDTILGGGGNDVICSEPDAPGTSAPTTSDNLDGGAGNDSVYGAGTLKGGAGDDLVIETSGEGVADGGSGNDYVASYGFSKVLGGSGDDQIRNLFSNPPSNPDLDCGAGDDLVEASGGTNVRRCEGTFVTP